MKLHFTTSSRIKSIVGKDLITDPFVAIFELVKNAYDANATVALVSFDINAQENLPSLIRIEDNGIGMSKDDLISKWLRLAYSDKEEGRLKKYENDDSNMQDRIMVGSKGIGRFSCDSLGALLTILTKKKGELVEHRLDVDWRNFEKTEDSLFESVEVDYSFRDVSSEDTNISYTKLRITEIRHDWGKEVITKTKEHLKRLKNPFIDDDGFELYCGVNINSKNLSSIDRVRSNIADVLKNRSITVELNLDGDYIKISLIDRGNEIYRLQKKNQTIFAKVDISLKIVVNYLTTSAKNIFKRRMGTDVVNYGNVFVYRNGFKVSPYGNNDHDLFGINARKAQGYNRYIGTREIIGYISIDDKDNIFKETSSRNNGFIESIYFESLIGMYMEYVHKPLEKYVRLVQWGEDNGTEISLPDVDESETTKFKKGLSNPKDGFTIEFFNDNINFEQFSPEKKLKKVIATLTGESKEVASKAIKQIEKKSHQLMLQVKDIERKKAQIIALERQAKNLSSNRSELSFAEQLSHHFPALAGLLHYSLIDLNEVQVRLPVLSENELYLTALRKVKRVKDELQAMQDLLLKTSFDLRSKQNLAWFELAKWYFSLHRGEVKAEVSAGENFDSSDWVLASNAIEVIMMFSNFYNNATEHGASMVHFYFDKASIKITSDSHPIDIENIDKIFDLGFSTKPQGTGIGLSQIKTLLNNCQLSIEVANEKGLVSFLITKEIKK